MKYRPDKNQITWAMTMFFTCIALAVAIYLLFHLGPIFTWLRKVMDILQGVFYGVVIAYVLSPIVNLTEQKWLIPYYENKGVLFYAPENRTIRSRTRIVSVVIAIFVATVMLVGLLGIVIPQLIQSITVLLNSVPSYLDNVNNWINQMQAVSDGNNEILNELQEYYNSISSELMNFINRQVMPNMNRIVQGLTDYLTGFISMIVNLFIGIIVSVYLLFSKEHFSGGAKKITYGIFKEETANQIISDCRFIHKTFIGFLVGKTSLLYRHVDPGNTLCPAGLCTGRRYQYRTGLRPLYRRCDRFPVYFDHPAHRSCEICPVRAGTAAAGRQRDRSDDPGRLHRPVQLLGPFLHCPVRRPVRNSRHDSGRAPFRLLPRGRAQIQ